ncbi:MAG: twin-arginine translocase TatA/TatE family subunit [Rhodothermales bacterium]|nr:twin-arginine translocase TatA/TatE family subunit [Rhodothermales bacterium]
MGTPGPFEIILIFLVILLIFGAKRIPEIARGLGKGIREFKDATTDIKRELSVDDSAQHRIQAPRQGEAMARQQPYQQQAYQPPQPPQQPAPPQAPPPSEAGAQSS